MRILSTGGASYVGSTCLRHVEAEEHEVLAYDDLSQGHRQAVDAPPWWWGTSPRPCGWLRR